MTTDEKVQLAEQIARSLLRNTSTKAQGVKRNEWQRWLNYLAQCGSLDRAIEFADKLSKSVWLRPEPKDTAVRIASTMRSYQAKLHGLPTGDLEEILGYVGRFLVAIAHEERPPTGSRPGHRPGGRR